MVRGECIRRGPYSLRDPLIILQCFLLPHLYNQTCKWLSSMAVCMADCVVSSVQGLGCCVGLLGMLCYESELANIPAETFSKLPCSTRPAWRGCSAPPFPMCCHDTRCLLACSLWDGIICLRKWPHADGFAGISREVFFYTIIQIPS